MSPYSTLSKTKQKILAIVYHLEKKNSSPYGYKIWQMLNKFEHGKDSSDIRNVYRHLSDLCKLQYIVKDSLEDPKDAPPRHIYKLTAEGKVFAESKANGVLERLESSKR
jgi:DNA-binding PadR family transcriptional regulator